jgi:hypothetical protein
MAELDIKQSDLSVEMRYTNPAFSLLRPGSNLHENMFAHLSEFGLNKVGDIRIEGDFQNPSQTNAVYSLGGLNVHVRVWLDRLETFFLQPAMVDRESIKQIPLLALAALHASCSSLTLASYTIACSAHCGVKDIGVAKFTKRYVGNIPNGVGPVTGGGVVFYFGPESDRLSSSLTLDTSLLFSEALYIRGLVTFAGSLAPEKVASSAEEYISLLFGKVGLEI